MNFFPEFKWAVLHAFSNALGACRFEQGDVLYDTELAYKETWAEAAKHVSYSIQVKSPMRGSSSENSTNLESNFAANWSSRVVFDFCDHRAKITKTIETTQGRLYSLLWHGDINGYLSDSSNIPNPASSLLCMLDDLCPAIETKFVKDTEIGGIFLMPFDISDQQLLDKNGKVKNLLSSHILSHRLISLADLGFPEILKFVPTAQIAIFLISQQAQQDEIKSSLKKALYKPAKSKVSNKENFKISNHGFLKLHAANRTSMAT